MSAIRSDRAYWKLVRALGVEPPPHPSRAFSDEQRALVYRHMDAGLRGPGLVTAVMRDGLALSHIEQSTGNVYPGPLSPDYVSYFKTDPDALVASYIEKGWSTGQPLRLSPRDVKALEGEWFQEQLSTESLRNSIYVSQHLKEVREQNRPDVTEAEKVSDVAKCDGMIWAQVYALREPGERWLQVADREDAYQQCVVAVLTAHRQWDRRAKFTTYAWPWITRALLDWRKSRRYPPREDEGDEDANTVRDSLDWVVLRDTLREVPDSEMVVLTEVGYTDREIALLVTGDPDANIRMRKSRAKTTLSRTLVEAGFIHAPSSPQASG
jgi:DNA-directed RNA polymerase specialized sigma24 family protein